MQRSPPLISENLQFMQRGGSGGVAVFVALAMLRFCPSDVVTRVDLSRGRVLFADGDQVMAFITEISDTAVERLNAVIDKRFALRD